MNLVITMIFVGGTRFNKLLAACFWLFVVMAGEAFAASTFTISGYVQTSSGTGVEGVSVAGDSGAGSTITASDGSYSVTAPNNWSGTVTAGKAGWLITPTSKTYSHIRSSIANENYIAYQPEISGYVRNTSGAPLSGAVVSASGGSTITDANGYYEIAVPYSWSGQMVVIYQTQWCYTSTGRQYTNVAANQIDQNFSIFEPKISGYIKKTEGAVLRGAIVSASNTGRSAITDANGYYEISVPNYWSGTLTASMTGYTCLEPSKTYENVSNDIAAQNFYNFGHYPEGMGTPENPFRIYTAEHFVAIGAEPNNWNKCFIMMADINLGGIAFTKAPIAPDTSTNSGFQGTKFTGIFDGNNHTISNLTIKASTQDYIGLFGYVSFNAQIKNLGSENVNVAGRYCVGGLVGDNYYGMLSECYATGSVSGTSDIGGLVGYSYYGTITHCYATSSVTGIFSTEPYSDVGGLVGRNYYCTLTFCYATGAVSGNSTGQSSTTGGLAGNSHYCAVTSCYATGAVRGRSYVGGLMGENHSTLTGCYATGSVGGSTVVGGLAGVNWSTINGCYATGSVQGSQEVGGLVGWNYNSLISCYAMGSVSGSYAVGGLVGYDDDGFITDCYATGPVIGGVVGILVGGLVGYDYSGTLTCCYSTGQVSGDRFNIGGLVGSNDGASIGGCFWDMTTSGLTTSEGGIGKTTAQMKSLSTFISAPASWDFLGETANGTKDVWRMCVDGVNYPKLAWEYSGHGDFVCPDGVGLIDYAVLANAWMSESGEGAFNSACDISAVPDGKIDLADLAVFAGHWME